MRCDCEAQRWATRKRKDPNATVTYPKAWIGGGVNQWSNGPWIRSEILSGSWDSGNINGGRLGSGSQDFTESCEIKYGRLGSGSRCVIAGWIDPSSLLVAVRLFRRRSGISTKGKVRQPRGPRQCHRGLAYCSLYQIRSLLSYPYTLRKRRIVSLIG